jgi:hypothetical protein
MAEGKGIQPQGESLRRALLWLSDRRLEDPQAPRTKLIDDAALQFDLNPMEVDFLLREWHE